MSSVEDDNLKKNNVVNNTNNVDKELLQNPFVKDLLVKIDVLKNGIIKERKINAELSSKLKKFEADLTSKIIKLEEELVSKTSQIKILIQEKMDLEKSLKQKAQAQRKGSGLFDILNTLNTALNIDKNKTQNQNQNNNNENKNEAINCDPNSVEAVSTMANAEIRKLHETITELKFEKETYLQKMNTTLEQAENKKLEYTNKIKSLEDEIKNLQGEKLELQDRINLTSTISSQTLKETEHFKNLLYDYKKGKDDAVLQLNTWIEKCNKLSKENESYKKKISNLEENSIKMAKKLSDIKSLYIKVNLRNQMYHVKKVGYLSYEEIDIIFGKGEEGNYVMSIESKEGMEIVNIQDVESVNRVNNSKNRVDIKYMLNGKKIYISVLVPEIVVEQFVETYKIFYFESIKNQ
jgi:chromosome segregation ATPase